MARFWGAPYGPTLTVINDKKQGRNVIIDNIQKEEDKTKVCQFDHFLAKISVWKTNTALETGEHTRERSWGLKGLLYLALLFSGFFSNHIGKQSFKPFTLLEVVSAVRGGKS